MTSRAVIDELRQFGFKIIERTLDGPALERLCQEAAALGEPGEGHGGVRRVLAKSAALREFACCGPTADLAKNVLGAGARPVRATLFDKRPAANWKVAWHQDLTIAVAARHEAAGFGPWSVKDGVVHVQAPEHLLVAMLAARVHLDHTPIGNGELRVVPGSHVRGKLSPEAVAAIRAEAKEVACPVGSGGTMLMFPLLLHASSRCVQAGRRRVLHIEYAAVDLPGGLEWAIG